MKNNNKNLIDEFIYYTDTTINFDMNKYVDELMKGIDEEIERKLEEIGYVKVVHCKYCKWKAQKKFLGDEEKSERIWCTFFNAWVSDKHYCSIGEYSKNNYKGE